MRNWRFALILLAGCTKSAPSAPPPASADPIDVGVAPAAPAPATDGAAGREKCALPARCPTLRVGPETEITLERTECFGTCPVYTVTLHGNGKVTWSGTAHVDTIGAASTIVDIEQIQSVADLLTSGCFFDMRDEYDFPITDHPWANTTLKIGGKAKTVKHYLAGEKSAGVKIGLKDWCPAPEVLDKIEARIDGAAGANRWIGAGGKKNTNSANQGPNPWRQ
jgi:hypothetical protein